MALLKYEPEGVIQILPVEKQTFKDGTVFKILDFAAVCEMIMQTYRLASKDPRKVVQDSNAVLTFLQRAVRALQDAGIELFVHVCITDMPCRQCKFKVMIRYITCRGGCQHQEASNLREGVQGMALPAKGHWGCQCTTHGTCCEEFRVVQKWFGSV